MLDHSELLLISDSCYSGRLCAEAAILGACVSIQSSCGEDETAGDGTFHPIWISVQEQREHPDSALQRLAPYRNRVFAKSRNQHPYFYRSPSLALGRSLAFGNSRAIVPLGTTAARSDHYEVQAYQKALQESKSDVWTMEEVESAMADAATLLEDQARSLLTVSFRRWRQARFITLLSLQQRCAARTIQLAWRSHLRMQESALHGFSMPMESCTSFAATAHTYHTDWHVAEEVGVVAVEWQCCLSYVLDSCSIMACIPVCCAWREHWRGWRDHCCELARHKSTKVGLCIGNSQYTNSTCWPELPSAVSGATAVAQRLASLGVSCYPVCKDLDAASVMQAMDTMVAGLTCKQELIIIYFAGHAVERNGSIHLCMHDAADPNEREQDSQGFVSSEQLLKGILQKPCLRDAPLFVMLDCCLQLPSHAIGNTSPWSRKPNRNLYLQPSCSLKSSNQSFTSQCISEIEPHPVEPLVLHAEPRRCRLSKHFGKHQPPLNDYHKGLHHRSNAQPRRGRRSARS